jgi:O-antigen/teichoic acid export membrane protein
MGVIKKQTIKGSIYSYLGVAVGFLVTFISVKQLTTAQIGLTGILVAVSGIYSQFSTLGFTKVIERLFPYFRDEQNKHNGFLFLTVAVGLAGFTLSLISFLVLKPWIIEHYQAKSPLLVQYVWYLVPLIFFRMFSVMLDTYNKMLFDATTGTILTDFVYRIGNLILLGAYYLKWIDFPEFVIGYVFFLSLPAIYLTGLLIYRGQFNLKPRFDFLTGNLKKEIISLAAFGLIGGLSSVALKQIDTIMVLAYIDEATTGIYTILFFFGTVVLIPSVALGKISSTIIADSWKKNDITTIQDIYYKSSINQLFFSLLVFILIVTNLHNIFEILGPEYKGTDWVVILISLSNLIVASTGSSVQIIGTSHKYKIQTYSLGVLVILSVIFYAIFIPIMGINGAALGSLLSVAGASLMRVFYLHQNMKLFPYKLIHLKCLAFGVVALLVGKFFPVVGHYLIDLMVRSSVISVIFIGLCYFFPVSDELNRIIDNTLKKLKIKS